eukprot:364660-Chlamydomonas_euryale.AAC.1
MSGEKAGKRGKGGAGRRVPGVGEKCGRKRRGKEGKREAGRRGPGQWTSATILNMNNSAHVLRKA